MKTTKKHFETFKKEFLRWVKIYGCEDYNYYFYHESDSDVYASVQPDVEHRAVRVKFNKVWTERPVNTQNIKQCARHEASHMLIARLLWIARARYCQPEELSEEDEAIATKLCSIMGKAVI